MNLFSLTKKISHAVSSNVKISIYILLFKYNLCGTKQIFMIRIEAILFQPDKIQEKIKDIET